MNEPTLQDAIRALMEVQSLNWWTTVMGLAAASLALAIELLLVHVMLVLIRHVRKLTLDTEIIIDRMGWPQVEATKRFADKVAGGQDPASVQADVVAEARALQRELNASNL